MNHFVVAVDCTGCGLCVDYCPVDCITLEHDDLSHKGALSLAHEYQSLYEKKKITDLEKSLEVKQKKDILKDIDDILSGL
jgi:Na+-translocating ferredoxin:NAD+ oxidoreductase RNF subunit RnfB